MLQRFWPFGRLMVVTTMLIWLCQMSIASGVSEVWPLTHLALASRVPAPPLALGAESFQVSNSNAEPEFSSGGVESGSVAVETFPVRFNRRTLFTIQSQTLPERAATRAAFITNSLQGFATDWTLSPDDLELFQDDDQVFILARSKNRKLSELIANVTEADATAAGTSLDTLAQDRLALIQAAIIQYRENTSLERRLKSWGMTLLVTLVAVLLLILIQRTATALQKKFEALRQRQIQPIPVPGLRVLSAEAQTRLLSIVIQLSQFALIGIVIVLYVSFISTFHPATQQRGMEALATFVNLAQELIESLIDYLPKLIFILLIIFLAYQAVQLSRLFFKAIRQGRLAIPGFYAEWARPTSGLVTMFIILVAAATVVPYLPGYESLAFRGLSVVVGILFSIGGASTFSNVVAGFILIFSRAFSSGDLIKIDQVTGLVYEHTLLAIQIRTFDGEFVTIPNSTLLNRDIVNYSVILRELNIPITVSTTITIGYDVPWGKVHQALISAAQATPRILEEPVPEVLQTSLDDFYVSYKLKAYTKNPGKMPAIKSELLQSIQNQFREAGIEIMSPHYAALRDGDAITIPKE